MNWIDLFPTSILTDTPKDITFDDIALYKKTILEEPIILNTNKDNFKSSLNQKILDNVIFSKISKKKINLSKKYLNEIGHNFEDTQISNSWSIIFQKGNTSELHQHKNSYISGVYYLTSGSEITFKNPHINSYFFYPECKDVPTTPSNFRSHSIFRINPKPNFLILFPSFLEHIVEIHDKNEDRIGIAFNIIPKGEFGGLSSKLYL